MSDEEEIDDEMTGPVDGVDFADDDMDIGDDDDMLAVDGDMEPNHNEIE